MNHDERHGFDDFGRCAAICLAVFVITVVLSIGAKFL